MRVYSIFDKKIGSYGSLITVSDPVVLDRDIARMFSDSDNNYVRYPSDYAIYLIGSFDDVAGVVTPSTPPLLYKEMIQYVNREDSPKPPQ